jgi:4-amino-4-deoxy-L-arabinose transferase-like glycosyltransferase
MKQIYLIWAAALIIKLVIAAFMPFFADESYYWMWGRHLQLSYFDHPPIIALLFYVGQFFNDWENAARWPTVILGHFTLLIWVFIGSRILNLEKLKWLLILLLFSPFTGAGSLVATPDIPLLFFWSLSVLLLIKSIEQPLGRNFLILGLVVGAGFLSKYHSVLIFFPALYLYLKHHSLDLRFAKNLAVASLGFFIIASPVFIWNYFNDWASFAFQTSHGLGESKWQSRWTLEYIAAQTILIYPVILYLFVKAIGQVKPLVGQLKPHDLTLRTLIAVGAWPLIFFLLTSFKGNTEANWPIAAYPAVITVAVWSAPRFRWATWALGFWAIAYVFLIFEFKFVIVGKEQKSFKTRELVKYEKVIDAYDSLRPMYLRSFQMASMVGFSKRKSLYKMHGSHRPDFYDFLDKSKPSYPIYYVAVRKDEPLPSWAIEAGHVIIRRWDLGDPRFEVVEVIGN